MILIQSKAVAWIALPFGLVLTGCFGGESCTADCAQLQDARECYRDCHYASNNQRSCEAGPDRDVQELERGVGYVAPSLRR